MRLRSTRLTAIANSIRDKFYGAALNMRFDNTTSLDPRVTFSRTTNATLTNSAGLIANAPMNLLTFSEQFDNAAWTKTRASISANTTTAPDGTTTADKFVEDTSASNTHQTFRSTAVSAGTPYTFSVYIKADGRNFAGVRYENGASTQFYQANVNLTNGTATTSSIGSPTGTSFSVTSAGDDWWRVSITVTAADTSFASVVYLQSAQGSNSYTGNGVSGAFLWGAQLEVGSTATTYNPTTVKNLLGFTENFDNAAWTKSNAFVQTNLAVNSVFANTGGAAPTSYTQSFATGTSAPSGTASNGNVIYTQTATAQRPLISQAITTVVGVVYTSSMTITEASGLTVADVIGASGVVSTYTLNGASVLGTVLASPGVVTATWTAAATTSGARFGIGVIGNATGSISFHGAQLVQGTTPGDYKATYAAAAAVGYTDIYGQPFAQKLVENTASADHKVSILGGAILVVASPYVFSVYAKAGERSFVRLMWNGTSTRSAYFNLATGAIGTVGSSTTAFIEPVGNGWYRCAIRFEPTGTSATMEVYTSVDGTTTNYTGDGTSGIYIFGAQLSDSASVDPYVYQPVAAPTSTAYYGPRFDYDPVTLAPKGLLIEEQRTNLVTYSEQFDNVAWAKTNASLTANSVAAPNGTTTADTATATAANGVVQNTPMAITVVVDTTYTTSVYLKRRTGVGAISLSRLDGVYVVLPVTDEWQRFTVTSTAANTTGRVFIRISTSGDAVDIWGAQLEAGSFATSYIPTVASQVTRAADSASMIGNNFARWYNVTQGTLFADYATVYDSTFRSVVALTDGSNNFIRIRAYGVSGTTMGSNNQVSVSGSVVADLNSGAVTSPFALKVGLAYATNDFASAANGGAVSTDTLGAVPTGLTTLVMIGGTFQNGSTTIKRIAYYNRRLSNTEL